MPRRSERAADEEAQTPAPADGTLEPSPDPLQHLNGNGNGTAAIAPATPSPQIVKVVMSIEQVEPVEAGDALALDDGVIDASLALGDVGPRLDPDPGLYAVLGLDPSVSDVEIQTTYRRQAARFLGGGARDHAALRQLNVAYEVLGNRARRDDYDRLRLAQLLAPGAPSPIRAGTKAPARVTKRRRPRHAVQPNYAGFSYVFAVLLVVGVATVGAYVILPRLSINLSALNVLQSVMPLPSSARSAGSVPVTPSATAAPTATPGPGVAARFGGSTVSVSNVNPAQNSVENVLVKLRLDGGPAANSDVWAIVHYNTTDERWPATGSVKTDSSGAATITFNIGRAIPQHAVPVDVFAQVNDQQFSWSTTFTPR